MSKLFEKQARLMVAYAVMTALLLPTGKARAENGISLSGSGVKSGGMAGVSIAYPQDAIAAADNPAGMGLVGSRADFDVQLLKPVTDFSYGSHDNVLHTDKVYPVPSGGINWQISPRLTFGVSLFGVGVGTSYGRAALPIEGAGVAKSSLQTVIAAPTVTYRLTEHNIIGFSASLAYQRFSASGAIVPLPDGSLLPLASHGTSTSFGSGFRVGYIWQPTTAFTFGASYASRIRMGKLSGYRGDLLAASDGRLDVGEQYGAGVAYHITPAVIVAGDWMRVSYSHTIIGSPRGFAWQNQNFYRAGISWDINSAWTLRSGYTHGNHPYASAVTAQNLLSAMPISSSVSAGATYRISEKSEVSADFDYGIPVTLQGTGASAGFDDRTRAAVLGLSFGRHF
jgi:long-chain fatty acid transport protein